MRTTRAVAKAALSATIAAASMMMGQSRADAQAIPPGVTARPVTGDPGVSSMNLIDEPGFRVLRDYAEPGATRRMHKHADATWHVFTLLTGTLRLTVEGEAPKEVKAGEVVHLKGGVNHSFTNTGTVVATIVEVFGKPGG